MDFTSGIGALHQILKDRQALEQGDLNMDTTVLQNQYNQLRNNRYGQETPLTLEKILLENQSTDLANKLKRGTLDTDISSKRASNQKDELVSKTKASIERNNLLIEAYTTGGKPELVRRAKELGVAQDFFDNVINAPNTGEALAKNRELLMQRLARTPETLAEESKKQMDAAYEKDREAIRHNYRMEEIEAQGKNALSVADRRAEAGNKVDKPAKTAEEAMLREIARKEASGEFSHEEAQLERSKVFNARNAAKVQPGSIVSPEGKLESKPSQIMYTPSRTSGGTIGEPGQPIGMSLDDLRKLYPGIPDDKLKAAFKKKFGIDIQ